LDRGGVDTVGIYARWTLDCVVDAATTIAQDYRTRYRQYRDVPPAIAAILANMNSRVGYDPAWPNAAQRSAIYSPLIGSSDGQVNADSTSSFHQTAIGVRTAAIAYSERVYNTGEPMLRRALIEAARLFSAYLSTLSGGVVDRARQDTEFIFSSSVQVLQSAQIAQAFGLPPAPPAWPLPRQVEGDEHLDGNGAYLIQEVSRFLKSSAGMTTQQQFLALQRVALSGARTIQSINNGAHNIAEQVPDLIGAAYTWATALRDLEATTSQAH
jgi:hypothetical protein